MYGDCQVMASMGANGVSSEGLFSSPVQNPNFNFMPSFQPFSKEEMLMESGSGSEQMEEKSGNEQEISGDPLQHQQANGAAQAKKKRYHRHTARQIQEMESLFKECPHPDDKQRMKLSQDLGLKPRQVKFWFQNRRTQMKAQQDRSDNAILRAENESLKNENYRLQAALRNIVCPNCGGPAMIADIGLDEQQLRLDNARLREELERVCCMTSRYTNRPMGVPQVTGLMPPSLELDMNIYSRNFSDAISESMVPIPMMPLEPSHHFPAEAGLLHEDEKQTAMDLAVASMSELLKMCHTGAPLWIQSSDMAHKEALNVEEHARMFPWPNLSNPNDDGEFRTEATRDSAVVIMNSITLVDAFLDANKWMELFPSIVSRAKTLQVISSDASGQPSGCLQLMIAEFQFLSPLVPTREAHFLRYCHHNLKDGIWVIVDFPIESFHDMMVHDPQHSLPRYRRRPSGCVIQDMPNGYSRVTWVEHAEIEEKPIHQTFSDLVQSGMAFGASRWLAVLQRQCERLASLMARNISDVGVLPSPEARQNMMKLAQRMIKTFCVNISTSGGQSWTALDHAPDSTVRITQRTITELGQPNGVILGAVSTTWLPYPQYQVFDLLRDENRRSQLEALSNGNSLKELAHIANGSHPGNCISLLRINVASNSAQHVELMLQESCTDKSGSLVVYSTMEVEAIQHAMSGQDPSCIPLLPIGFFIIPADPATTDNTGGSSSDAGDQKPGCLLTVGLQMLVSTVPTSKINLNSITTLNNHLGNIVQQIAAALAAPPAGPADDVNNNASASLED